GVSSFIDINSLGDLEAYPSPHNTIITPEYSPGSYDVHPTINICNPLSRVVTKVDTLGIVVPSWPVTPHISFTMSNSHLDWIWSLCTTSPDPASGMSTLRDTCVALLNYPLTSSSFIPAIAGLALHPSVAEPFREVFPILKHLMYSAAQHHGVSQPLFDLDHADFRLVTILGVRRDDAEAAWGRLLQKVADAMGYIELYTLEEMSTSAQSQAANGTHFTSTVLPLSSRSPPRGTLSRSAAPSMHSATESIVHASRAALPPTLPVASPPPSSRRSGAHSTCPVGQSTLRREFPSRQAGRTVEEFHDKGATGRVEMSTGYRYAVSTRTRTLRNSQSACEGLAEAHEDAAVKYAGTKDGVDTGHIDDRVGIEGERISEGLTESSGSFVSPRGLETSTYEEEIEDAQTSHRESSATEYARLKESLSEDSATIPRARDLVILRPYSVEEASMANSVLPVSEYEVLVEEPAESFQFPDERADSVRTLRKSVDIPTRAIPATIRTSNANVEAARASHSESTEAEVGRLERNNSSAQFLKESVEDKALTRETTASPSVHRNVSGSKDGTRVVGNITPPPTHTASALSPPYGPAKPQYPTRGEALTCRSLVQRSSREVEGAQTGKSETSAMEHGQLEKIPAAVSCLCDSAVLRPCGSMDIASNLRGSKEWRIRALQSLDSHEDDLPAGTDVVDTPCEGLTVDKAEVVLAAVGALVRVHFPQSDSESIERVSNVHPESSASELGGLKEGPDQFPEDVGKRDALTVGEGSMLQSGQLEEGPTCCTSKVCASAVADADVDANGTEDGALASVSPNIPAERTRDELEGASVYSSQLLNHSREHAPLTKDSVSPSEASVAVPRARDATILRLRGSRDGRVALTEECKSLSRVKGGLQDSPRTILVEDSVNILNAEEESENTPIEPVALGHATSSIPLASDSAASPLNRSPDEFSKDLREDDVHTFATSTGPRGDIPYPTLQSGSNACADGDKPGADTGGLKESRGELSKESRVNDALTLETFVNSDVESKSAEIEPGGLEESTGQPRSSLPQCSGRIFGTVAGLGSNDVFAPEDPQESAEHAEPLARTVTPALFFLAVEKESMAIASMVNKVEIVVKSRHAPVNSSRSTRELAREHAEAAPPVASAAALPELDNAHLAYGSMAVEPAAAEAFVSSQLDLTKDGRVGGANSNASTTDLDKKDLKSAQSSSNWRREAQDDDALKTFSKNHHGSDTYIAVDVSAVSWPAPDERDVDICDDEGDPADEPGGLEEKKENSAHSEDSRDKGRTLGICANQGNDGPASAPESPAFTSNVDSPPSNSVILPAEDSSKIFALVSAIIRSTSVSYLGAPSLVGERTPYRAWEREGIGTGCWKFEVAGTRENASENSEINLS
ncbi:hypothetical protein B0H11DRAFT_2347645, partial [Mycena galericulata]